jgi:Uncharacterized conserved protein
MEYVYPAIFHANSDGSYTITYPDLQGCISEGKSLNGALYMAQTALTQWIDYLLEKKQLIPSASRAGEITVEQGEFVEFVRVTKLRCFNAKKC